VKRLGSINDPSKRNFPGSRARRERLFTIRRRYYLHDSVSPYSRIASSISSSLYLPPSTLSRELLETRLFVLDLIVRNNTSWPPETFRVAEGERRWVVQYSYLLSSCIQYIIESPVCMANATSAMRPFPVPDALPCLEPERKRTTTHTPLHLLQMVEDRR
jgi:hypothetical protein